METHANTTNLVAAAECLLFLAEGPLAEAELARMLEASPAEVKEIVAELSHRYEESGLQVMKIAGGWQLCTRPEYADYVGRLHEPEKVRLSRAALETLAIIAYRQPITRPEMEALRGVSVDGVISTLLNHGLIEEKGRKEAAGRPMLYGTTTEFLVHFGLDKVEDLPALPAADLAGAPPTLFAANDLSPRADTTEEAGESEESEAGEDPAPPAE